MDTNETTTDYGVLAQRAAEDHLEACWEYLRAEDEDDAEGMEDPAVGPFCGCETCVVREVLHAAWPILQQAALELD